jgi:CBS domain containing-hemolysin-like protein
MPESDTPNRGAQSTGNLPIPVPRPSDVARDSESWLGRVVRSMFGWKPGSIRADLESLLNAETSHATTGFSPAESRLLRNILDLRERRIVDVMLPRADIVSVASDIAIGELVKVFESAAHSRLVVYNETLDDPVGMIHIRDLIAYMTKRAAAPAKPTKRKTKAPVAGLDFKAVDLGVPLSSVAITRPLLYVPPSMPAIDLLAKMQATRVHLALVIDEYGGTDGLVSMEDIVEQIVGDIQDEHDEGSIHTIARQTDGSYLADSRASLEEVVAAIGPEFEIGEAGEEVDTLGGFVVTRVGRVPVRGELVPGPGLFEFEVLDADPRRLKKIRIYQRKRARETPLTRPPQSSAPVAASPVAPDARADSAASTNPPHDESR